MSTLMSLSSDALADSALIQRHRDCEGFASVAGCSVAEHLALPPADSLRPRLLGRRGGIARRPSSSLLASHRFTIITPSSVLTTACQTPPFSAARRRASGTIFASRTGPWPR